MSPADALPGRVHVAPDPDATALAAAEWLRGVSAADVAARGEFHIALSGGSTPTVLYRRLVSEPLRSQIQWERWWVWFVDERAVYPDALTSNYNLAVRTLGDVLDRVAAVVRMEGERTDIDAAAAEYAQHLAEHVPRPGPDAPPQLDCVLLGLGENGHTASLFPDDPSLEVTDRWAVHSRADYAPFDRITLTFPVLNAARRVAFLVTGDTKAEAFAEVVDESVPAGWVSPTDGELHWFLDEAAAATLP